MNQTIVSWTVTEHAMALLRQGTMVLYAMSNRETIPGGEVRNVADYFDKIMRQLMQQPGYKQEASGTPRPAMPTPGEEDALATTPTRRSGG